MSTIAASWATLRDRLLARPEFRRWASSVPGLRAISRRQSRRLFDLVAGFTYSQVLLACVQIDLFERLSAGPMRLEDLAREAALPAESADILVRAAVSLDLLEWRGKDSVGLGMLGAVMVDNPAITALVRHHQAVYEDLTDPLRTLREPDRPTRLRNYWAYARDGRHFGEKGLGSSEVRDYSELMSASQPLVAEQVLQAYDFARHRCVLDVGGGRAPSSAMSHAPIRHSSSSSSTCPPWPSWPVAGSRRQGWVAGSNVMAGAFSRTRSRRAPISSPSCAWPMTTRTRGCC